MYIPNISPALAKKIKSKLANGSKYHVVNHHIPKCSGKSLVRAFRSKQLFTIETMKTIDEQAYINVIDNDSKSHFDNRFNFDFKKNLVKYYMEKGSSFISGHVPFFEYRPKNFSYKRITVVREPVTRFLSHYNMCTTGLSRFRYLPSSISLEEFIKTDIARYWGRMQCIFISGRPSLDIDENDLLQLALKSAESFDLIGFQHDILNFNQKLNEILNTNIKIRKLKDSKKSTVNKDTINQKQLELIKDICRVDIELYNRLLDTRYGT